MDWKCSNLPFLVIRQTSKAIHECLDKLEQRGLLSRNACPDDRRVIHVILTDNGNELMNEIMPKYHELVEDMFDSLNSDEAETLVHLLEKIRKKV
jgi:MarR family transcriptional regulator, 2-MHQ and catechol-resistance regulon repressor